MGHGATTDGDVRGFLHVCCIGGYREVLWEIVHTLLESRLYDRSALIEVGVLGAPEDQRVVEEMLGPFPRFRIAVRSPDVGQYEFPTLGLLADACRTWDGPVYYLHTKGVSHPSVDQYSRYWRRLMLDHIVTRHRRCVAELANSDTVGVNWLGDHYGGNFWWARATHIRRLPDIRALQHNPRDIGRQDRIDGQPAPGRGLGPEWNTRLQCEHWLHMATGRIGRVGPRGPLHLYREAVWTVPAAAVIAELRTAIGARRVAEIGDDDGLPDGGAYDLIVLDLRADPARLLARVEGCLAKVTPNGAIVVRHSNPPTAWHQRPAAEFTADTEWTGQVWRAVVAFRARHPWCQAFTVDTDWGVTVIRPGRRPWPRTDIDDPDPDWPVFATRRRELLNLVDVAWFRRYLSAEPHLADPDRPPDATELINTVIAAAGSDSYLRIGTGVGEDFSAVIAPIRVTDGTGADRLSGYDVVSVGAADLDHALTRVAANGWIAVRDGVRISLIRPGFEAVPATPADLRSLFCIDPRDDGAPDTVELANRPYAGNRELLSAAVALDPDDLRSVLHLGDSCFTAGDHAAARTWYARAVELRDWWWSGFDDGIYVAMMRIAESMTELGEPWPEIRDTYLRAWELRPDRVAPLYMIAARYRIDGRYQLGYLYAKAGVDIPPPEDPATRGRAFHWRIRDELAVCASWTDRTAEAFATWREVLGMPEVPDPERHRITANRDACVPAMLAAAAPYPEAVVRALAAATGDPRLTVSIVLGPLRRPAEQALNSFLHCCLDVTRAGRFVAIDAGLTPADRVLLQQRYGFLEFSASRTAALDDVRAQIDSPLWLHLGRDWRCYAPDALITRLESALAEDSRAVGVTMHPGGPSPTGPTMFDTARLDAAGGLSADLATTTLGEPLCARQTRVTVIGRGNSGTRAIAQTLMHSGVFMGEPIKADSADLVPAEDLYEACRIIGRYIPWRGGLTWDFGPVQSMPIPAEFTQLVQRYLDSVLSSPEPRVGWKLPETTLCYPWIRRLMPELRYIFWVRDPRDCITNHHFTDDLRDFGIDYPPTENPYIRRAISWKYQDDLVAATPRPRHWITVRLEDFVQHQERELARLEHYLGFPLARMPVRTDPVGRHRRVPGMPIPEFLESGLRRHGYLGGTAE